MSDTESDIEDIPHDEIVKKLQVPEFQDSPTSSGGEEDDESSEPEDVVPRTPSRLSATPTDEQRTRGGQTPIETDAEQRSRSQIAITLPASSRPGSAAGKKTSTKVKTRDKTRKSSDAHKQAKLLHPNRTDSRGSSSGRRSRGSYHDTSGTSGSDTALSDVEQDERAVTFQVEYGAAAKFSDREIQAFSSKRRPEIIVSNVQDVGRGGIINTHGQPSRFLPQKEKGLRRGYGRSRRLRKSSGSSRSPSQSGEEYYTTDDEGKRKKHGSKDRKDKSRRDKSKEEKGKSSKKKGDRDSKKRKDRDKSKKKKLKAVRFFAPGDEKTILKILDAKRSRLYGKQTTELNIDIESVQQFSYEDELRAEEYAPPGNLSPRSAAKYVKHALKKAAKERKALKKAKKKAKKKDKTESGNETDAEEKKKKKRKEKVVISEKTKRSKKRRRRRRRRKRGDFTTTDEEDSDLEIRRQARRPTAKLDSQFYPNLRAKLKRSWVSESKPVTCTICQNVHYRTKLNFAANLKIIIKVNNALGAILMDMRGRMKKIDHNLGKVKKNIEYMEDMYEEVFRRINRLISNENHVDAIISFAVES